MQLDAMISTAQALVAPGRASSPPTRARRRWPSGSPRSAWSPPRSAAARYRQLLFTTPGIGEHISGVILFDETVRQRADDGTPFAELLRRPGVVPGIKVDRGTTPLAGFPDEVVTEGLDGLRARLAEYASLGARFAKWRAVIRIGEGGPTPVCVEANTHALARYAALAPGGRAWCRSSSPRC